MSHHVFHMSLVDMFLHCFNLNICSFSHQVAFFEALFSRICTDKNYLPHWIFQTGEARLSVLWLVAAVCVASSSSRVGHGVREITLKTNRSDFGSRTRGRRPNAKKKDAPRMRHRAHTNAGASRYYDESARRLWSGNGLGQLSLELLVFDALPGRNVSCFHSDRHRACRQCGSVAGASRDRSAQLSRRYRATCDAPRVYVARPVLAARRADFCTSRYLRNIVLPFCVGSFPRDATQPMDDGRVRARVRVARCECLSDAPTVAPL